ncbi:hypothetical protein [Desulfohalovibrio reitneri]|nr:hypothetical protein [Desulfohalovibrio reitneri]
MPRPQSRTLDTGAPFPRPEMPTLQGDSCGLPGDLLGGYAVVLIYRGHW